MRVFGYVLLLVIFAGGCATSSNLSPSADKAIVRGSSPTMIESLNVLNPVASISFEQLDGQKISSFWKSTNEISVSPGKHEILVKCSGYMGGGQMNRFIPVYLDAKANKIYTLKSRAPECNILVE